MRGEYGMAPAGTTYTSRTGAVVIVTDMWDKAGRPTADPKRVSTLLAYTGSVILQLDIEPADRARIHLVAGHA